MILELETGTGGTATINLGQVTHLTEKEFPGEGTVVHFTSGQNLWVAKEIADLTRDLRAWLSR